MANDAKNDAKNAPAETAKTAAPAETAAPVGTDSGENLKLNATQKQIVSNLRALAASTRGAIAAVQEGDIVGFFDMLGIMATQHELCVKLGKMEGRKYLEEEPVSAPPSN